MAETCNENNWARTKYGAHWEQNMFRGLHTLVAELGSGYVHRMYKPKFTAQTIDILVDNVAGEYYGVECKTSAGLMMHPTQWFSRKKQLYEETLFLSRSGRTGIIAYMMPTLRPGPVLEFDFSSYLIPWDVYLSVLYGGGRMTAGHLDVLARNGLFVKIPTTDGTVSLPKDVFQKIQDAIQRNEDTLAIVERSYADSGRKARKIHPFISLCERAR